MSEIYVTVTYGEDEVARVLERGVEGMPRIDVEASKITLRHLTLSKLKQALPGIGHIVYIDREPADTVQIQCRDREDADRIAPVARQIREDLLSDPKNFALPDVSFPHTGRDIF